MSLKRSKRLLGANQFFDGRTPGAGPDELKSILEKMGEQGAEPKTESGEPTNQEPIFESPSEASDEGSGKESSEASRDGSRPQGKTAIPFSRIVESMTAPASKAAGIRYSLSELDLMEDVIYQVWKESGKKLQKQEIARLALRVLLEEYSTVGKDSILWRYLQARYRPYRLE